MKKLILVVLLILLFSTSAWSSIAILKESDGVGDAILKESDAVGNTIIKESTEGEPTVLGIGNIFKYMLISEGETVQVPEGATGCVINDCSIRGTLDLAESVDVYNTWVTTIVLTGLAADEPVVFYNCAFIDSEAVIEAKNALDDLTFTDCLFEISAASIFKDYTGADFNLVRGSAFCDVGYDTGPDTDLNGRPTPQGVHDIGPYEFRGTGLSNLILLLLQGRKKDWR